MSEEILSKHTEKYISFDGIHYTREKSGRYASYPGKLFHRTVWEHFNGKIPKGYVIHHIDGAPSNNDLANLQLMTHSEHIKLHQKVTKWICKHCGKEFESRGRKAANVVFVQESAIQNGLKEINLKFVFARNVVKNFQLINTTKLNIVQKNALQK